MDEEYKLYLQSEAWKEKASRIKSERNYRCEICGNHILLEILYALENINHPSRRIPEIGRFCEAVLERSGDRERLIEVHHLTYKRKYHELDKDLACVCRPCHVLVTENADKYGLEKSWEITVNQVKEVLKKVHNQPNGQIEFTQMTPVERVAYVPEPDPDLVEAAKDYYDFLREFYNTQESFGYPRE